MKQNNISDLLELDRELTPEEQSMLRQELDQLDINDPPREKYTDATKSWIVFKRKRKTAKRPHSNIHFKVLAACAAIVLFFSIPVNGMSLCRYTVDWTKEHLSLSSLKKGNANHSSDSIESLKEAVLEKIPDAILPTWLPESFELQSVEFYDAFNEIAITFNHKTEDRIMNIVYTPFPYAEATIYEKMDADPQYFTTDNIEVMLIENTISNQAICVADKYVISISGQLSMEELENIAKSIQ